MPGGAIDRQAGAYEREPDVYGWAAVDCTDTELRVVYHWMSDMMTSGFMLLPLVEASMKLEVGHNP